MNLLHRLLCRSALWRWTVERCVIPWALDGLDPGADVLELGPGPGLTTDVLRERTARLTAVELDPRLASSLQERMKNTNVEVVETDPTAMPFPDGSCSGACCVREAYSRGRTLHRAFSCSWPTSATPWSRLTPRPSAIGSRRLASMSSRPGREPQQGS
jgi:SAM-dependent methyltransferase